MFQEWVHGVQQELQTIDCHFAQCDESQRGLLKTRFQQIQASSRQLLEVWATVEDQLAHLVKHHPELTSTEAEEMDGEFWIHADTIRSFRHGQGYYQLKMFAEAHPYFKEVVETEPTFLLGRLYLALNLFQEQQWSEAEVQFTQVADEGVKESYLPFAAFAHHMLGCIAVSRGQEEEAIASFQEAIALKKENADTWFNLGACYYRLGRYEDAIVRLYQVLSLNEQDWEAMHLLAECYKESGQWKSVLYWRLSAMKKSHHPTIIKALAHDCEERGQPAEAVGWYKKLLRCDPWSVVAYHGLAWNNWALHKRAEARCWLKKGLSLHPNHPDLLFFHIWCAIQEGELTTAEKAPRYVTNELLQHPVWLVMRSRLAMQKKQITVAKELATAATQNKVPAMRALGYFQLGQICIEEKDAGEAISHFRQAGQLCPAWKEPAFYEGVCHFLEGRVEKMQECWQYIC
ncbi:tetratricopeptide repeat protein [Mechercharimyces sp. CAU 1602]|uniref:tetratricopeptide repeat protein n=1 Tax=Mechercharimyces sp. CAU 1602 TaxID=2973933 RepID=UPI002163D9D5|nr:tetratricopeptide repeat protein [Mechercharimyces sp. CAU 1602]MCS1351017.1 tetratricopeptide repeat protein [Mechercharimyces sp. CAU 1602]